MATFVLLYFTGQTLNVFTLGGLALGVGRLVDDSIVELENIHRHLALGQSRRDAVLAAAQEVAMPILVSTITTIVVFFPVLFLTGVARNLFMPLALTIAFALIMSFFVSRTVTPLLCLYWLKGGTSATRSGACPARSAARSTRIDHAYARSLGWVLRHRLRDGRRASWRCSASSLFLKRFIGTEFFPDTDESQFASTSRRRSARASSGPSWSPSGSRTPSTRRWSSDGKADRRRTMISDVGLPLGPHGASSSPNTGPHSGNVQVNLVPRSRAARSRRAGDREGPRRAARRAAGHAGLLLHRRHREAHPELRRAGADRRRDRRATTSTQARAYAKQVAGAAARARRRRTAGRWLTDVQISREENYPELDVVVDRQKAGDARASPSSRSRRRC